MSMNRVWAGVVAAALLAGSLGIAAAQTNNTTGSAAGTGSATSPAPGSNTSAPTTSGAGAPNPSR